MKRNLVERILEQLSGGDTAAAAEVFQQYEPYLRMVVRRKLSPALRAKFDSLDVVQSVWADLLQSFRSAGYRFTDAGHLRAFLVRATHNRFIDRARQHRAALNAEVRLPEQWENEAPSREPRPSQVAEASDLWDTLLAACPPEHRELLELKREGRSLAEIAERTGLHYDSIRRILRGLARRAALSAGNPVEPNDA
jgi:RNA polymerase sigma-70 factor (ECF subfamily)